MWGKHSHDARILVPYWSAHGGSPNRINKPKTAVCMFVNMRTNCSMRNFSLIRCFTRISCEARMRIISPYKANRVLIAVNTFRYKNGENQFVWKQRKCYVIVEDNIVRYLKRNIHNLWCYIACKLLYFYQRLRIFIFIAWH